MVSLQYSVQPWLPSTQVFFGQGDFFMQWRCWNCWATTPGTYILNWFPALSHWRMLIQWLSCSWCLNSSIHGTHPYLHNSLSRVFTWSSRLNCRTCRIWSFHFRSTESLSIAHRSAWLVGRRVCWTRQLLLRNRLSELYRVIRVR